MATEIASDTTIEMTKGSSARLCTVSGRVQGVWYRASTQKQAQRLAITGFAQNLADGRVEVLMQGPKLALDELQAWLSVGPPLALVESVDCVETIFDKGLAGFSVQ